MPNHIQHIDDIPAMGLDGAHRTIDLFRKIALKEIPVYQKWDGAPAVIIGYDNDEFFVATKSYHGKSPQLFKTPNHIKESSLDEPLKEKLLWVFHILYGVKLDAHYQGDLLFTRDSLFTQRGLTCFQPNTLVYGMNQEILDSATLGIAWHTNLTEGKPISHLDLPGCWSPNVEVNLTDAKDSGDRFAENMTELLSKIEPSWYSRLEEHPRFFTTFQRYKNHTIRNREKVSLSGYMTHIDEWYAIQIASKKTEKARERWQKEFNDLYRLMGDTPNSYSFFLFLNKVTGVKNLLINILNRYSSERIMVHSIENDMYIETGHEGYVVHEGGDATKLVEREKFSFYNFSPIISKGWNSQSRT